MTPMVKYHMNPQTGEAGVCRATKAGGCPFGIVDAAHKTSPEDVYSAMEAVYADYTLPKPKRRTWEVPAERRQAILAWVNPAIYMPRSQPRGLSAFTLGGLS